MDNTALALSEELQEPEVTPVPPLPTPKRRYKRHLNNVQAVVRALGAVLDCLEHGEVDPRVANSMIHGYSILIGALKDADLEARISKLEKGGKQ
jgi:flagellin-specific chaperone FliS